jgi:hypothetical protein
MRPTLARDLRPGKSLAALTADWSTVALALGPATVTGLVAYYGVRRQADTAVRQLEADERRLSMEQFEGERQNRQNT